MFGQWSFGVVDSYLECGIRSELHFTCSVGAVTGPQRHSHIRAIKDCGIIMFRNGRGEWPSLTIPHIQYCNQDMCSYHKATHIIKPRVSHVDTSRDRAGLKPCS